MSSFRRLALALALTASVAPFALAQAPDSSSNPPAPAPQDQPAASKPLPQSETVQARIRARREQRRIQAIRDVYSQRYEINLDMGYLRFTPGPNKQRVTYYGWNTGVTRYYSQRLGATVDFRGYYGTPFVGLNFTQITRPAISTYTFMGGPTYRLYMQPKYSIAARVLGGYALGNFSSDTNHFGSTTLGMYPDGGAYSASAAILADYNVSPNLGLRLAPEYVITGFGSSTQYSRGFTAGFVFRFGKQ